MSDAFNAFGGMGDTSGLLEVNKKEYFQSLHISLIVSICVKRFSHLIGLSLFRINKMKKVEKGISDLL